MPESSLATVSAQVARLLDEDKIGTRQVAKLLLVHPASAARIMLRGLKQPDGSTLRLEYMKSGGKLISTRQAVIRFLAAQQQERLSSEETVSPRSPASVKRAASAAAAELQRAGI